MLKLDKLSIVKITVPIMLGTFIQNIVMITDAILVNKLGTTAFDAANNAGLFYLVFFMLNRGLGDGSQIQIAKEFGQQNIRSINHTLNNSFFLQFVISTVLITLMLIVQNNLLDKMVMDPAIESDMKLFLDYRIWGLFFAGFQVSIMAYFIGIGKTRIIIVSTLLLALTNIFLDFGLIFGNFGLPEMGIAGAALASTIAEGVTLLFLVLFLLNSTSLKTFGLDLGRKIITYKSKLLLKLSWPLMLSGFLSIATWFVFFSFIEQRNAFDLEVSHVVRNLFFISFIPIFGFASSTRTYVAYFHGRNEMDSIRDAQKKLLFLSILFYSLIFHGALFYPELMVNIITDRPDVIAKSASILQLIFGSMLLFSIVVVFYNSVSAIGKTIHTLIIEFISILIYLITSYYIIVVWQWDIFEVWAIEYLYFGIIGILSIGYLYYFNQKHKITINES